MARIAELALNYALAGAQAVAKEGANLLIGPQLPHLPPNPALANMSLATLKDRARFAHPNPYIIFSLEGDLPWELGWFVLDMDRLVPTTRRTLYDFTEQDIEDLKIIVEDVVKPRTQFYSEEHRSVANKILRPTVNYKNMKFDMVDQECLRVILNQGNRADLVKKLLRGYNIALIGCFENPVAEQIAATINNQIGRDEPNAPNVGIALGDLIYNAGATEPDDPLLQAFVGLFANYIPFFGLLGNHDYNLHGSSWLAETQDRLRAYSHLRFSYNKPPSHLYRAMSLVMYSYYATNQNWLMPFRYYWLTSHIAKTHFIILDSSTFPFDLQQQQWLRDTYNAFQRLQDIYPGYSCVLFLHHPLRAPDEREASQEATGGKYNQNDCHSGALSKRSIIAKPPRTGTHRADKAIVNTPEVVALGYNTIGGLIKQFLEVHNIRIKFAVSAHVHGLGVLDVVMQYRAAPDQPVPTEDITISQYISGGGGAKFSHPLNITEEKRLQLGIDVTASGHLKRGANYFGVGPNDVMASNHGYMMMNITAEGATIKIMDVRGAEQHALQKLPITPQSNNHWIKDYAYAAPRARASTSASLAHSHGAVSNPGSLADGSLAEQNQVVHAIPAGTDETEFF